MRYDNWDVILFPKDSAVPIQEFRTTFYSTQDEHGRQLPTLTCFIASLPAATSFRISIHSWIVPAKPSTLIESRRRTSQKVVFATQLIVDGDRVFRAFYDAASRWPQEISDEKRIAIYPQQSASQRGPVLEFPPFRQDVLTQPSWNPREHSGRIKVLLSEQLMGKNINSGEPDLGVANDIVCFTFQHAPQEILEQAGISWPIRNPLYLASDMRGSQISQLPGPQVARPFLSQLSPSVLMRPRNTDPFTRPSTDPPLHLPQLPRPTMGGKIRRSGLWDPSFGDSSYDDLNASMPDMLYASPIFGQTGDPWTKSEAPEDLQAGKVDLRKQTRRERGVRQVVVTLREDQLGQLIEAMSPPKKSCERTHTRTQPPMADMVAPTATRPSAVALARKGSHPELRQKKVNKTLVLKENPPSSQAQDGPRLLSGFSHAGRVPTPHPFVVPQAQINRWNSDIAMRDISSMHSNFPRPPRSKEDKTSPAPTIIGNGSITSRKEGIDLLGTSPSLNIRHDQSMLPGVTSTTKSNGAPRDTSNVTSPHAHLDIDAVGDTFVPGHKGGMSSIDSTRRLERKLYSALGEELSFHADADPMPGIESEAIAGETDLVDLGLDAPITKRRRQDTLGGEGDRSPVKKMMREQTNEDQGGESPVLPNLRGGD
ncbi:uncharacterized protein CC84DRAFT_1262932 [Paraphaeosphaeria sporulosa]|uniref:Uncharacterized protein n=1 Tax=Paraphaeosphaeria sporulosa TaxID=1460663 RepID=A0A177BZP3_9PLEO|nr:uncharacterized protein CC84DRAFT_1262932 [Paraphaeosphaeria sporulosa]OAG00843.1 hypothetical protein CC84DRAFT_1262932 [Paraphaeosphaeria sporulosa]